jgi:hypothetical protein
MAVLLISVRPLPAAAEIETLRRLLFAAFPAEESRAYLERLTGSVDRPLPPRLTAARLGALSLLPPLLDRAKIPTDTIRLSRDEHGRPFGICPAEDMPPFDFNLSHSDGHVACALLVGSGRVGIDVEEAVPPKKALPLLSRYATPGESAALESLSDAEKAAGFTRLWVIREALAKQDGRGMPLRYDASEIPPGLTVLHGVLPPSGAHIALCAPVPLRAEEIIPVPPCPAIQWQT